MELSSIAHQLDEEERMRMAEGGVTSEDYRTFLQVLILNSPNCVFLGVFLRFIESRQTVLMRGRGCLRA